MAEVTVSSALSAGIMVVLMVIATIYAVFAVSMIYEDSFLYMNDYLRANEKIKVLGIYNENGGNLTVFLRNVGYGSSSIREVNAYIPVGLNKIAESIYVAPGSYAITSKNMQRPFYIVAITERNNIFMGPVISISEISRTLSGVFDIDSPFPKTYLVSAATPLESFLPAYVTYVNEGVMISTDPYVFAFIYSTNPSNALIYNSTTREYRMYKPQIVWIFSIDTTTIARNKSVSASYRYFDRYAGDAENEYAAEVSASAYAKKVGNSVEIGMDFLVAYDIPWARGSDQYSGAYVFACVGIAHKVLAYEGIDLSVVGNIQRILHQSGSFTPTTLGLFVEAARGSLIIPATSSTEDLIYELRKALVPGTTSIDVRNNTGSMVNIVTFTCASIYSRDIVMTRGSAYSFGGYTICLKITYGSQAESGCNQGWGSTWRAMATVKATANQEIIKKTIERILTSP